MEKTKHLPAEELLKFHWSRELPVNTIFMALDSKVRVMTTGKVRVHHIDIDKPNDSYVVLISNRIPREFVFYTIAHCLGHIHCGHLEDKRYLNNDEEYIHGFEEEANAYARQLVAPLNILKAFKDNDKLNIEQILDRLQTSEDVVKKQLAILEKH
jgi:Zn-dependent peptidase ImmA (M78 family)